SSWNFSKVRNAPKSTEPSLLNVVISATNEPVSIFLDIAVSIPDFATLNPIDRFIAAFAGATAKRCQAGHSVFIRYRAAVAYGVLPRRARAVGLLPEREIGHPVAPSSERRPCMGCECLLRWRWPAR